MNSISDPELSVQTIRSYLDVNFIHQISSLEILDRIGSTNDYLKQYLSNDSPHVRICFAEEQTAGRGRRGRSWVSPKGNIYLSILYPVKKILDRPEALSLIIGLSIIQTVERLGINSHLGLKWPNDVVWKDKKLAGVLIESFLSDDGALQLIIGIGVNVDMPKRAAIDISQSWIDLSTILNCTLDRNQVAGILLSEVFKNLSSLEKEGLAGFQVKWQKHDVLFGKQIIIEVAGKKHEGVAQGIDNTGNLILQDNEGKQYLFATGEATITGAGILA